MVKGYDPSSLGLVRKGNERPDGRFTPVEYSDKLVWALNPIHFNSDVLQELRKPYEGKTMVINDTSIYVDTVEIKGVVSHDETTDVSREMLPIYAGPNKITGQSPEVYAYQLEQSDGFNKVGDKKLMDDLIDSGKFTEKQIENIMGGNIDSTTFGFIKEFLNLTLGMARWKLVYHPTLFNEYEYEKVLKENIDGQYIVPEDSRRKIIKLNELKDIDMNSLSSVTVSAQGSSNSISYPLQNLIAAGHDEIEIEWVNDTFDGFWYIMRFAGKAIQGRYSQELIRHVVISDYVNHMLQNTAKEIAENANIAIDAVQDIVNNVDWDKIKVVAKEAIDKLGDSEGFEKRKEEEFKEIMGMDEVEWRKFDPDNIPQGMNIFTTERDYLPSNIETLPEEEAREVFREASMKSKAENKRREFQYEKDRLQREEDVRKKVDKENRELEREVKKHNQEAEKFNMQLERAENDKANSLNNLINTVVDTGQKYAFKMAEYEDMKQSSSNVGGNLLGGVLWQQVGALLTIDYPTTNYLRMESGKLIKPGDFAVNQTRTYDVKKRFNGVDDMMKGIRKMYPGEIVKLDCDIIFKHGLYNDYFNDLVSKGALLEWRD